MKKILLIVAMALIVSCGSDQPAEPANATGETDIVDTIISGYGTYVRDRGNLHRLHDDALGVTCWTIANNGLFCIPDHELERP